MPMLVDFLSEYGQSQLLSKSSFEQIKLCWAQCQSWDSNNLKQISHAFEGKSLVKRELLPLHPPIVQASQDPAPLSDVGVVILAGGMGSRFGALFPKGMFLLDGKSLFERICEKIVRKDQFVAVLTSSANRIQTETFFQQHHNFGLSNLFFFSQSCLPLFNETGQWFWEKEGVIAEGPDGNGSVFASFVRSGIANRFLEGGVKTVHILPIDNMLAEPCDASLWRFQKETGADIVVKCISLHNPLEAMGRLVWFQNRLSVAEFAELNLSQQEAFCCANTGLLAMDLHFMYSLSRAFFPWHWAYKKTRADRFAWKAERFIVDALDFAKNARILCYLREECYAPLKEQKGIESVLECIKKRTYEKNCLSGSRDLGI